MYLASRRRQACKVLSEASKASRKSLLWSLLRVSGHSSPHTGDDSTTPCLASPPNETRGSQQELELGVHRQNWANQHGLSYSQVSVPCRLTALSWVRQGFVQDRIPGCVQGVIRRCCCFYLADPVAFLFDFERARTLVEGGKKEKKNKGLWVSHPSRQRQYVPDLGLKDPEKSQLRLMIS